MIDKTLALNSFFYHSSFNALVGTAIVFAGLTLALVLGLAKRQHRGANLFLSLAVGVCVFKAGGLLPLVFPALGPLIYFYARQKMNPGYTFKKQDLIYFSQLLAVYWLPQWLILLSVVVYLYFSHRLIQQFYHRLQPVLMDRPRYAFRQLNLMLRFIGLACLIALFYPVGYMLLAFILIGMAAFNLIKPDMQSSLTTPVTGGADVRVSARGLKEAVAAGRLYEDPGLTLGTLAVKLHLHPHDLSHIINTGLNKNFSDFIGELRVREVIRKMQDKAYDHLTLVAIAYESGFNSQRTFNRVFREVTGKTPAAYKSSLRKEWPIDKLATAPRRRPVLLRSESRGYTAAAGTIRNVMIKNHFKIAWRNLIRNKAAAVINIGGLAIGMAVALLIGLWIADELAFDRYHENYDRLAQVMQKKTFNGTINTQIATSLQVEETLRRDFGSNFTHTGVTFWTGKHILATGDKKIASSGTYVTPEIPEMFTLKMIAGARNSLTGASSILISRSVATALFGSTDPVGKLIKFDDRGSLAVTGVYEDLPENTTLHKLTYMVAWGYFTATQDWLKRAETDWAEDSFHVFVQVADQVDMQQLSAKIAGMEARNGGPAVQNTKPEIFLQPMSRWHLYEEFKNGVNTGGAIQYVRLFAIIGVFVLLLACINFMNLSTARSEKRAKEVGIRKAVGSDRGQLIAQFYVESLLIALLAFAVALGLAGLCLPAFNELAGKETPLLWASPYFWLAGLGFAVFTALLAGSYPALYLSSFSPLQVLKGTFKAGPAAAIPRKVLVVAQFTVSIVLIVGTVVVFRQVQFAQNRPVGYTPAGLVNIETDDHILGTAFYALRQDMIRSGAVTDMTRSSSPATAIYNNTADVSWTGKDPGLTVDFANIRVTTEYGKTVGWHVVAGRDFATNFLTDSSAVVLNEAAVRYMGLQHPVGQTIILGRDHKNYRVIGVIHDMVMGSPYEPVKQAIYTIGDANFDSMILRINPATSSHEAISRIGAICQRYMPAAPFTYQFVDDAYAQKFVNEERVGKLATAFSVLAIFISCLGLFGMASFMAEQRVKEIGVRKILGASVLGIWGMLSKDFVVLILAAILIATPLGYGLMHHWLMQYAYHAPLSWWIFGLTAAGAILITLLTVSYQSIRAALANPVKSLRSE